MYKPKGSPRSFVFLVRLGPSCDNPDRSLTLRRVTEVHLVFTQQKNQNGNNLICEIFRR